ncbi:hypothetical protein Zmor_000552 [Zophobas morio]|uniref:Uncharacterized protein n=1 Tax=Zophobas morio TaxID=2755281 RepID=A0AA38J2Y7_9CUCU|nr:hypothetical protein Zmor_000552 [Zophobas morio]
MGGIDHGGTCTQIRAPLRAHTCRLREDVVSGERFARRGEESTDWRDEACRGSVAVLVLRPASPGVIRIRRTGAPRPLFRKYTEALNSTPPIPFWAYKREENSTRVTNVLV